jgi:hypothetical protein
MRQPHLTLHKRKEESYFLCGVGCGCCIRH